MVGFPAYCRKILEEMVEKSKQISVPVVEINEEIIVGFDLKRISKSLGIRYGK